MQGPAHVVAAVERAGGVALALRDGQGVVLEPLAGPFAWRFGVGRRCVGRFGSDGHTPCPANAAVGDDAQCLACSGLEHPECVFEPLCQADPSRCLCERTFKGVEHVVYLAFHGTLAKVGMTQRRRLATRLREQGADAYFVVQGGLDRAGARLTEKAVAMLHRVPEHRSHRETLPLLARPVPWDLVERSAAEWRGRLAGRFTVEAATLRIEDHPLAQPLDATPRRRMAEGRHAGTWLGGKGNHLFYREAPRPDRLAPGTAPIVAVRRSDLLGRSVEQA